MSQNESGSAPQMYAILNSECTATVMVKPVVYHQELDMCVPSVVIIKMIQFSFKYSSKCASSKKKRNASITFSYIWYQFVTVLDHLLCRSSLDMSGPFPVYLTNFFVSVCGFGLFPHWLFFILSFNLWPQYLCSYSLSHIFRSNLLYTNYAYNFFICAFNMGVQ